ncbi:hypothetical protein EGT74_25810 [Chitinophaga lutea]|uniref:DUF4915 domain-containing protein n=1 Tax=Chitinophaga lutea TaxID=2488634 RepID=A0A3N4PAX4_9BACT|nr:hypothetical protein [Chitinophaga lutea]RPE05783.1 hypothetical protein EGT74_25810 [Chitinophaga lutea]
MKKQIIKTNYLETIDWFQGSIVDWRSAGQQYKPDGTRNDLLAYTYSTFDGVIASENGTYVFLYKRLGTKGLLLKNGILLREINRSYYFSDSYEYPAAFITFENRTYLAHCPLKYCRLDFEDVETGELVTDSPDRHPGDTFHSRLLISPDKKFLMVRGWEWHPVNTIALYNIEACFNNPALLDNRLVEPAVGIDVNVAAFLDGENILIGSTESEPFDDEAVPILPENHIAIWNHLENTISPAVKVQGPFGNVFPINSTKAWDLFRYPKIIDIETGEVLHTMEDIDSGKQNSSFISQENATNPQICFDSATSKIAIRQNGETIIVLAPEE